MGRFASPAMNATGRSPACFGLRSLGFVPRSLLLLLSLGVLGSCSRFAMHTEPEQTVQVESGALDVEFEPEDDTSFSRPVSLTAGDSFISNHQLNVRAYLTAETAIDSDTLVISLIGLDNGKTTSRDDVRLSRLVGDRIIKKGERVSALLAIPAVGLSEYQIACSWGTEAEELIAKLEVDDEKALGTPGEGFQSQGRDGEFLGEDLKVRVSDIQEEATSCRTPPCPKRLSLKAQLWNMRDSAYFDVELGVGLSWLNDGAIASPRKSGPPLRPDEESVKLRKLWIRSESPKRLHIRLDREVPSVPGGHFVPNLRLISYEKYKNPN